MLASTMAISTALVLGAAHPGLYFTSAEVPALRAQAQGTHKSIADHLVLTLTAHLNDPAPVPADYSDPRFFGGQTAAWAFAFQLTGDTRFSAKAHQQLFTYLGWTDWGFGEGGPDLNSAHMLLGAALTYDWIWPTLTAAERTQVQARLAAEAQRMFAGIGPMWWTGEYVQNHHWIDTGALGLAALVLQGEDARAAGWLAAATDQLSRIAQVLGPISDGSFHEGLPYQVYGLAHALPFWAALARAGTDYTDLGILRGYGAFRLGSMIPEAPRQTLLPYGDFTGWASQGTVAILRYSAARFGDGKAEAAAQKWLAAGSRTNFYPELFYEVFEFLFYDPTVLPTPTAQLPQDSWYPDLQAAVLKSSWSAGDLQLGFKGGPYGGRFNHDRLAASAAPGGHLDWGHDHNDDLSFWIYGGGTWLAPEAAGYTAGKNVGATNPANTTAYHNNLLVDGLGQLGDVRASDSEWNNPWFWKRDATPLVGVASTADYAVTGGRGAGLFDAALGLSRWDRLLVLARHRYALVRDDVASSAVHAYDWVCHFPDGAEVDPASGWVKGIAKSGQLLGLRVLSPANWTATTGSQSADQMSKFDSDGSTAFVRIRPATPAANVQFLTALVPVAAAVWTSRTAIDPLSAVDPGAGAVVGAGSALEERWVFSRPGADGQVAGDLALTQGLLGAVARRSGAHARAFLVGPGKISDQGGARELLSSHSASAIEADLQGTTLAISGSGIADFRAYAPGATRALLNGVDVEVGIEGGLLVFPKAPGEPGAPDAGSPPGADAGASTGADAGASTGTDAGAPGGADAGAPGGADAGATGSADAGAAANLDGGAGGPTDAGGMGNGQDGVALGSLGVSGCGCRSGQADLGFGLFGLGLALALRARRRRSQLAVARV